MKKGTTFLGGLYKNNQYIGEVYKGDTLVNSFGWHKTVSGQAPLSLPNARSKNTSWEIEGKSKQGRLPDGYTELEYIESTGKQYIMTGLYPGGTKLSAEVKFQASASAVSSSNYPCLFSCFTEDSTKSTSNVYSFGIYNGKWRYKLLANQGYGANADTSIHTIHWNKDDGTRLDSDTALIASRVTVSSSNTLELPLFTRKANAGIIEGAFWSGKVYYAKFWNDSNALVRNFVPAKNSSDVVGMYDLVSGTFYTNQGTDSFTAGPELPSPSNPLEIKAVGDSGLPSGYKKLEYIESSGTQYIDTGINPSGKKIGAIVDFQFTSTSRTTGGVFGSNKTDGTDNCQFTVYTSKWRVKINKYAAYGTTYNKSRHTARLNMPDGTSLDSTVYTSTQYTIASSNNLNCFIGACNYGSSSTEDYTFVGNLYSAKVYDDTTLVRNFIPAKDSSNVIGMYDTVTNTFFTNAGTGTFIAGPEDTSCVVPVKVSDGTTETTYPINLSAPLQGFGNYKDSIESDGTLTRALGVKVFTGTETFVDEGILDNCWSYTTRLESDTTFTDRTVWCSHFKHSSTLPSGDSRQGYALLGKVQTGTQGKQAGKYVGFGATTAYPTLAEFQAFLASEYANGTPVTIVWYKKTATTSTIAVPTIATAKGDNTFDATTEVKPSNMEVGYVSKTS